MYARRFFKPLQLYVILNIFSSAEWNYCFSFLSTWKSNNANIFGYRCFICVNIHCLGILNLTEQWSGICAKIPFVCKDKVPSTLSRWNLKTQQSTAILHLRSRKTRSGNSNDNRNYVDFKKLRFQNVFRPRENEKPAFSNSFGLKSVFEKLRFCDALMWSVDQSVEIKLRFQISPAYCGRCLRNSVSVGLQVVGMVY